MGLIVGGGTAGLLPAHGQPPDAKPKAEPALPSGEFGGVTIRKRPGSLSALDFHLDGTGRAIRFYVPGAKDPFSYFGDSGQLSTKGSVLISGTSTGTGAGFHIEHPSKDPAMLGLWSDVNGPTIQARSDKTSPGAYLFSGLDEKVNYVFSIEADGKLQWGASTRQKMDANLYRAGPGRLKTDGTLIAAGRVGVRTAEPAATLHVAGSQAVHRTAVAADYALTDTDYYVGVTDTSASRTITLPPAAGREGRVYVIKDETGGAGRQPIAVRAADGEAIDGSPAATIRTNYGVLRVISNGANWFGM
jgi:hypothetical protein